jgi:transposase-like protein
VPNWSGPGLKLLAEQLVEQAGCDGVALTGPGGLLTGFTQQVFQTALQVEMAQHLGYETGDLAGHGSGNSRNGTTPNNRQGVDH